VAGACHISHIIPPSRLCTTSFPASGPRHDIQELVASDDVVAARVVASGTHQGNFLGIAPTGKHVEVDHAPFARLQDG
jgi:predicted ester cyclase